MKPSAKGKSPKKWGKSKKSSPPPKGVQTITSMFRQQSHIKHLLKTDQERSKNKSSMDTDSDDDVLITNVESKYFDKSDDSTGKASASSSPYLKKSRSSPRLQKSVSGGSNDGKLETVKPGVGPVPSSSQKENDCDVNPDVTKGPVRKSLSLSLRKRKIVVNQNDSASTNKRKKKESHDKSVIDTSSSLGSQDSCSSSKSNSERRTQKTVGTKLKRDDSEHNTETKGDKLLSDSDMDATDTQGNTSTEVRNISQSRNSESRNCDRLVKEDSSNKSSKKKERKQAHNKGERNIKDLKECEMDSPTDDSCPTVTESQTDMLDDDLKVKYKSPYYHENFKVILSTVLGDVDYVRLFNEDDMKFIKDFQTCSDSAQKLYIRLFSRKLAWLPVTKIKYPEIEDDLVPVLEELSHRNLLQTEENLTDLQLTLNILSAGDIKTLAKTYHVNVTNQNKSDIVQLLMKKSRQTTIGSMFKVAGCGGSNTMLNRAKKLLGRCVHLVEERRTVFLRTLMLFSLNDTILDEDNGTGSQGQQLFQMLQVNIGTLVYPSYTVNKCTTIFGDRDTFLRFADTVTMEGDILTRLEKKNYDGAFDIYQAARTAYDKYIQDATIISHDSALPAFLRSYTACGVCVRVMNQGVELLQRRKNYTEAISLLEKLLSQQTYCLTYRGHWWERLALNYEAHLKQPAKALKCIQEALDDPYVRTGHRLALFQRAEKLCTAPKSKFSDQLSRFHHEEILDFPKVYLDGKVLPDNVTGAKYRFLISGPDGDPDDLTFCGVEQFVMEHYLQNGYTDGLHAEGSTVKCLFTLFFWDIIYSDVPDAFHSAYQSQPLDLRSDHFYSGRKDSIDRRLDTLKGSSEEELHEMVSDVWSQHEGEVGGMSWDRFTGVEHAKGLVSCFGGPVIAGILERYAKNPRQTGGGFPDLTLWNTNDKTVKICEVKGPGDRLSHKQILWLSYLLQLGVDAEVCHVKAVGTKMLKPTTVTKEESV